MLTVEREFALAIYVLYAADCIHWLKPGQMALTRRLRGGWRPQPFRSDSYTLLGRMPVFVNPIDFRPSYLAGSVEELRALEPGIRDLAARYSSDAAILILLSVMDAVNLLIFLPALLLTGYLPALWRIPAAITLFTQLGVAFELFTQGTTWRRERPGDFWPQFVSLLLNPLAALRSGDVLLRGMFGTRNKKTTRR
jgi:hypothetical protein